jgi:hypothetical protein
VLFEDGRLTPEAVLAIASDLVVEHNFERSALSRSYLDLVRRGHVRRNRPGELEQALSDLLRSRRAAAASELVDMIETIRQAPLPSPSSGQPGTVEIDYLALVAAHNPRHKKKRSRAR